MLRKTFTKVSALLILLCLTTIAGAQVRQYQFSQSSGSYSAITGTTTVFTAGWDDDAIVTAALPFTFTFNGTGYTSCKVNANGYLTFGTTASSTNGYTPISATTGYGGAVSAYGHDLVNNGTPVVSEVLGSSPNRVFVVQWSNARRYNSGAIAGDNLNFQIRLYETTNVVEIAYGAWTITNTTSRTGQVGLRGASSTDYSNRSTAVDFSKSNYGSANTSTITTLNTITPASGLSFIWTPASCSTPGTITVPAGTIAATSATINWGAASPAPANGYEWKLTSGGAGSEGTALVSGSVAAGILTANATGLTASTAYSAYVRSSCGSTFGSWFGPVNFTTLANCLAPTALTSASITTTTADVNWTANGTATQWTVEYGVTGFTPGTGTAVVTTTKPLNITGLTPGTNYQFYVMANCGGGAGNSTQTGPSAFTTLSLPPANDDCAGAIVIPSAGPFPFVTGATSNVGATDGTDPANSCQANSHKGIWYTFTPFSTGPWIISSAQSDAPLSNITDNVMSIFTSAAACAGPFTQVACDDDGAVTLANQAIITTNLVAGTQYYVLVYGYSANTGDVQLKFTAPPSCPVPTALTSANLLANTADVNWTENGIATQWTIEYGPTGFTPGTGSTAVATSKPFTLTGLSAATTYQFYITANCGGGSGNSVQSTVGSFTTTLDCSAATAISACGVASAFAIPSGTGIYNFGTPNSTPGRELLYTFTAPSTGSYQLQTTAAGTGYVDYFFKDVAGSCTPTGWIYITRINSVTTTAVATFNLVGGTTYFLLLDPETTTGRSQTFNIVCAPICPAPTALSSANVATTSADVNWTENGTATQWTVEYGATGFTPGTGTIVVATSKPFSLTGLIPGTAYQFYVTADCGGGAGSSVQVGPVSFTTPLFNAPANNECSGAISLGSAVPYNAVCAGTSVTTAGATQSANTSSCVFSSSDDDVWYTFTATATSQVIKYSGFTAISGTPTQMGYTVYGGSTCGTLSETGITNSCSTGFGTAGAGEATVSGLTIGNTYTMRVFTGGVSGPASFNLCIMDRPLCPAPTALSSSAVTSATASVNWTEAGSATQWTIEYGPTGFTPGTGTTVVASAHPAVITGLAASTVYQFYVMANCGGASGNSILSGPSAFTTLALPPANDDCANATSLTPGLNACLAPTISTITGSETAAGITPGCGGSVFKEQWFSFTANATNMIIEGSTVTGGIADGAMALYNACGGTLIECDDDDGAGSMPFIQRNDFVIGNTYYVAFWEYGADATGDFGICIHGVTCPAPTALSSTAVAGTTANVNWTENGSATQWTVEYGPTGFTPGTGTSMIATSKPLSLAGLNASTTYQFYVTANCGMSSNSTVSGPATFITTLDCNSATVIAGCATPQTATIAAGNGTYSTSNCGFNTPGKEMLYSFTAALTGVYTLNVTSATGGYIDYQIRNSATGCGPTGWTCIDDINAAGTVTFNLTAGNTYLLLLDPENTTGVSQTFEITCPPPPPVNDDATGAVALTVGAGCTGASYTNVNATQGATEPVGSCNATSTVNGEHSVWYSFTAPATGAVRISTDLGSGNTLSDSRVALFSASNVADYSSFSIISCDEDGGSIKGLMSVVYATGLTAGQTYYVQVDGYDNTEVGTFCLTVDELDNTMLSSNTCGSTYQTPYGLDGDGTYKSWVPLVDDQSKLVALVRNAAGGSVGGYSIAQNINASAVRQAMFDGATNNNYLDRNFRINNATATNVDVQFFFLNAELTAMQTVDPSVTIANLQVARQTGNTCAPDFVAANGTTTTLIQTGNGAGTGVNWISINTPSFSNFYLYKPAAAGNPTISAKIALQGAMPAVGTTMRNDLQVYFGGGSGLLPTTDPYGLGATYSQINNPAGICGDVVDWVRMEVRSAANPATVLESKAVILKTDGNLVDPVTGMAPAFMSQSGAVHLVLQHRNHIAIMSNSIADLTSSKSYDFTSGLGQAFNTGGDPDQMIQVNGVWCMWAGDVNAPQDLAIDGTDYGLEFNANAAGLFDVYDTYDLNMDGSIDGTDLGMSFFNNSIGLYSSLANY